MKEVLAQLVIAGSGPAGMTAAIYGRRAGLSVTVVEKLLAGGQMTTTPEIANYPGLGDTDGFSLSGAMERQAKALGAEFISDEIISFGLTAGNLKVNTRKYSFDCSALVLAMGARRRKLQIPGEQEFEGRGVSYCATCDGNFFKGKDVAVVGGGNTALEDALYLAGICRNVYLVHRRDAFRGGKLLEQAVRSSENIVLTLGSVPVRIEGSGKVESLTVNTGGEEKELAVSAVFAAVGTLPESGLLKGLLELDEQGRVIAGEDTKTNIPGVFAAGDLRKKPLYQIVTATADGAVAATMAAQFIRGE